MLCQKVTTVSKVSSHPSKRPPVMIMPYGHAAPHRVTVTFTTPSSTTLALASKWHPDTSSLLVTTPYMFIAKPKSPASFCLLLWYRVPALAFTVIDESKKSRKIQSVPCTSQQWIRTKLFGQTALKFTPWQEQPIFSMAVIDFMDPEKSSHF